MKGSIYHMTLELLSYRFFGVKILKLFLYMQVVMDAIT